MSVLFNCWNAYHPIALRCQQGLNWMHANCQVISSSWFHPSLFSLFPWTFYLYLFFPILYCFGSTLYFLLSLGGQSVLLFCSYIEKFTFSCGWTFDQLSVSGLQSVIMGLKLKQEKKKLSSHIMKSIFI